MGEFDYPEGYDSPAQVQALSDADLIQAADAAIARNVWSPLAKAALGEVRRRFGATRAEQPKVDKVFHVQGFTDERGVRGIHVMQHEGRVIDIARGVIETAASRDHTEVVRFERTWPLSGYGQESAVVEVDAVTRTTTDGGKSWSEMWHWFGTLSSPSWPTSLPETQLEPMGESVDDAAFSFRFPTSDVVHVGVFRRGSGEAGRVVALCGRSGTVWSADDLMKAQSSASVGEPATCSQCIRVDERVARACGTSPQ